MTSGMYSNVFEDIFQGEVPSCMVIGMVDAEAYSGTYNTNPFHFQHFNLASMGFYINGEPVPHPPLDFDIKDCEYLRGLLSLYSVTGKVYENTNLPITRDTYHQGLTLIGFNVDPTAALGMQFLGKP